ncbi:hypothetical protein [Saccharibacillus sacchari]|uniref:hypothetical protein n=1 Tax=Saccharibacillus sacchari TaxID=456493 RepID=UPI0004ADB4E1|nr:hypothetical protein [Saccharibacillus sacchari]
MSRRITVQDSPGLDEIRAEYDQLWTDLQHANAKKAARILKRSRRALLPSGQRLAERLQPFRSRLLWAIPLGTAAAVSASYVAFIWVALWVE